MKRSIQNLMMALGAAGTLALGGCAEYGDDLQALGQRLEYLEENYHGVNLQINALQRIVEVVEGHDNITGVVTNDDGSYTIYFRNQPPITLTNGRDGSNGRNGQQALISIRQDTDGCWYWTVNGQWLLDAQGNKLRAGGKDGIDGKDSDLNGSDFVIPQVRINETTRRWEISTDGGLTWVDTGVGADGKDGKDGTATELFQSAVLSPDGTSITITLSDGRTFTLPIAT